MSAPLDRTHTELARRLQTALFTPVGLLLLVAVLLGGQLVRMATHTEDVRRSGEILSKIHEVHRGIVDQETALRGYMLTHDRDFLEPYKRAGVSDTLRELAELVEDDRVQKRAVETLVRRYELWRAEAARVASGEETTPSSTASMRERKARMDDVREAFASLIAHERAALRLRSADASASRTTTVFLFAFLFVAVTISLVVLTRRQITEVVSTYERALGSEREAREAIEAEAWIRAGHAKLSEQIVGELSLEELGRRALDAVAAHVGADIGAFFTVGTHGFELVAGLALGTSAQKHFSEDEGLLGRALATKQPIHMSEIPEHQLVIHSGTLSRAPSDIYVLPAIVDGSVRAVMELGFVRPISGREKALLERISETIAIGVRTSYQVVRLKQLLEASRAQAEELQTQQEELRVSNEELVERDTTLREAQALLEERHEELMVNNARLEEQTESLEAARRDIAAKAAEVVRASQYKSEFLANMSHELRTPLNSSLILAKLLADNKQGNLTDEQVKFASTIYAAGNDLLALINDVLDLAKIEAGRTDVSPELVNIHRVVEHLSRLFEPLANEKKLELRVVIDDGAPTALETDAGKLDQILKNLLSNALKFTERGAITLRVQGKPSAVEFSVEDSGIGIADEQRELIFEAFRQVESASTRKYGGTGLGLSISRDLARLLGGDVDVQSEVGCGSVFTLRLPLRYAPTMKSHPKSDVRNVIQLPRPERRRSVATSEDSAFEAQIPDDRAVLSRGKRSVLIVEDDLEFASVVCETARELGFQCIVAHTADAAVALARRYLPSAVVLDIKLPDHSGLSVLDQLKRDSATRHIPVHGVSASDFSRTALAMGAVGYMMKPARRDDLLHVFGKIGERLDRALQRVLVVEDDDVQRDSIEQLLRGPDIEIVAVGTVQDALAALRSSTFDCVVTDLALPDASGFDLLEQMGDSDSGSFPPIIVYTGRSLTLHDEQRLLRHSSSIIVKDVRSPERLLDEVTLFLHRVESEMPAEKQRMLRSVRDRDTRFEGKTILVVEDDVRNIFALSSILEPKGARVVIARNGLEALDALEKNAEIALVLMDIMMPEMDGLEATRRIRQRQAWAKIPIIALTAKAMKDDHERCVQAGANDYVSKPFDADMLLSLIGIWMPR